jgi:hypothetical protein
MTTAMNTKPAMASFTRYLQQQYSMQQCILSLLSCSVAIPWTPEGRRRIPVKPCTVS